MRLKQDLFIVPIFGSYPSNQQKTDLTKHLQVTFPSAAPLLICAYCPLPHLYATSISWLLTSPLLSLVPSENNYSPPQLLNSMAIANLALLAAASFDTKSLTPQLGWALLGAHRRKLEGCERAKIHLQQQYLITHCEIQEIILTHLAFTYAILGVGSEVIPHWYLEFP